MKTLAAIHSPVLALLMRSPFEAFARSVFRFWCPLHVEGRDHLPQLPFIICSNHTSHMDSIALMTAAGCSFKPFGMLAASDYFFRNAFVFNCFSSMVHLIPIDRSPSPEGFRRTLALCREFLKDRAHGLILFPEGTRSRSGAIGPFRRGASFLAAELGVPVVPAHITGAGRALPIGSFIPRPHRVCVRFARPVYPGAADILDQMREEILSLEAQANAA